MHRNAAEFALFTSLDDEREIVSGVLVWDNAWVTVTVS